MWVPGHELVEVIFEDERTPVPLASEGNGYFSGLAPLPVLVPATSLGWKPKIPIPIQRRAINLRVRMDFRK